MLCRPSEGSGRIVQISAAMNLLRLLLPIILVAVSVFAEGLVPRVRAQPDTGGERGKAEQHDAAKPVLTIGDACDKNPRTNAAPHVVFLVGDSEYNTAATVPKWAKAELEPRGVRCTFLVDDPKKPFHFPELLELEKADAFFVSVRRRGPPEAQLAAIRRFAESGKPVIGIRTASHAFEPKKPAAGEAVWATFDRDVFGGRYQNHYGKGPQTVARRAENAAHPILTGWPAQEVAFSSHLYRSRDLAGTTVLLLTGTLSDDAKVTEPIAWVNEGGKMRAFYTSLGAPEDFENAAFRRLLMNAVLHFTAQPVPPAK